jgi:acetyltransferase
MAVRNLERMLAPGAVAIVGASEAPGKVGYNVLRNVIDGGFAGPVYPVNAKRDSVQGKTAYRSILDTPTVPDLAIICTPAPTVPNLIRQCGEKGIPGVVILTAGFRELGTEGKALEEQIRVEQKKFPGLRIIGPNCVGVICPRVKLSASFAVGMPGVGSVAFLSQSGALCTAVLDWALAQGIGFSQFLSLGNQLDVGFADLLDYLAEDPKTTSAILYVESISDSRYFMSAARAFARKKPLVAYKAGRFAESAKAAASHTGAMAGVDAVYQAAFDRAGIVRVFDMQSVFESAALLTQHPEPVGPRLAIVTNAGGPGVMATDSLLDLGGRLSELSDSTSQQLNQFLPDNWSHGNPVDVIGDADAERFVHAVEVVLRDEKVDTVLAILTPQAMTDPTHTAGKLSKLTIPENKALLASWMGGVLMADGVRLLQQARIPTFETPEQAIRGLMNLTSYSRNREILYETPRDIPLAYKSSSADRSRVFATRAFQADRSILTEVESKALLQHYEIPTTKIVVAENADQAVTVSSAMGYPVVMKIYSPQITHKTDVNGVALNLKNENEVRGTFDRMMHSARTLRPDAQLIGVTIQPMITAIHGVELILGAKRDPIFGTVMMAGLGGITAELFKDRSLELPPVNERLVMRMLTSLKCWPLLSGYRGRAAVNMDRLVEILLRFSNLIVEQPDIVEADINPLLIASDSIMALDARFVIASSGERVKRPYDHLAIRPYPSEFESNVTLPDGTAIHLRPIRPEDEPQWRAMLGRCSDESIWSRFHVLFKEATHEMATRFCFLDYDREIAIVAETVGNNHSKIVAVGRLVADADHQTAEFALLVEDAWQNRGLGTAIARHCMAIAEPWGVQQLVAETTVEERRMAAILRKMGFTLKLMRDNKVVLGSKNVK